MNELYLTKPLSLIYFLIKCNCKERLKSGWIHSFNNWWLTLQSFPFPSLEFSFCNLPTFIKSIFVSHRCLRSYVMLLLHPLPSTPPLICSTLNIPVQSSVCPSIHLTPACLERAHDWPTFLFPMSLLTRDADVDTHTVLCLNWRNKCGQTSHSAL